MSAEYVCVSTATTPVRTGRGRIIQRVDRVRITRIDDGAIMYEGPTQGSYTPDRPDGVDRAGRGSVHADWLTMDFDARLAICDTVGADPTKRPPRPRGVAPGTVAEFVGHRLVLRRTR